MEVMNVLSRQEKKDIASPWIQKVYGESKKAANLSFTDMEAAIQATEDWLQSNRTAFFGILPEPFKTLTTDGEKELILAYVLGSRSGTL